MNRLWERIHKQSSRVHICALCSAIVKARHYCYGCRQYVCDDCAGQANEKPLTEFHALKEHIERVNR